MHNELLANVGTPHSIVSLGNAEAHQFPRKLSIKHREFINLSSCAGKVVTPGYKDGVGRARQKLCVPNSV